MARPDLYIHTLQNLLYGATAEELSEKLDECIERSKETGKQSTLTLKLTIKPTTRAGDQYEIRDEIKANLPELDRGLTLMFQDENGNLTRENPRQKSMDLKSADSPKPTEFKQSGVQ